jgi:hypothetical protein
MFITLYAIACLASATPQTNSENCKREIVADSNMSETMTMSGCLGYQGESSARKFIEEHPLYSQPQWHFGGWACQMGNKEPPRGNQT